MNRSFIIVSRAQGDLAVESGDGLQLMTADRLSVYEVRNVIATEANCRATKTKGTIVHKSLEVGNMSKHNSRTPHTYTNDATIYYIMLFLAFTLK